ncbi:hypothetical protein [Paenibacillus glucanolyticus]|uniref:hypothetical protein n=1 Tax=Paenibacillus glucanolyticus TaxID=59843 RepID=UPI00096D0DEA|nr:hypothetical protein [Paenibacillus glucanolyticus]OMF76766.1 hypothetical protein BK142_14705 [Paenibacillus glucanolyticus]
MKKDELIRESNKLIDQINDPTQLVYGAGEFLEGLVADLIPYLTKDGLKYLNDQLHVLLTTDDKS